MTEPANEGRYLIEWPMVSAGFGAVAQIDLRLEKRRLDASGFSIMTAVHEGQKEPLGYDVDLARREWQSNPLQAIWEQIEFASDCTQVEHR